MKDLPLCDDCYIEMRDYLTSLQSSITPGKLFWSPLKNRWSHSDIGRVEIRERDTVTQKGNELFFLKAGNNLKRELIFYKMYGSDESFPLTVPRLLWSNICPRDGSTQMLFREMPPAADVDPWTLLNKTVLSAVSLHAEFWNKPLPQTLCCDSCRTFDDAISYARTHWDKICHKWELQRESWLTRSSTDIGIWKIIEDLLSPGAAWIDCLGELPITLLHGDLAIHNCQLDQQGVFWIYDWEKVDRGPAVLDLANLFFWYSIEYNNSFIKVIPRYLVGLQGFDIKKYFKDEFAEHLALANIFFILNQGPGILSLLRSDSNLRNRLKMFEKTLLCIIERSHWILNNRSTTFNDLEHLWPRKFK